MKPSLLIIEDETALAKQLKWGLAEEYEVMTAGNVEKARSLLGSGAFPVATLDLGLPPAPDSPREGFRLLEELPQLSPHAKVIVITGNAERENALRAVALGAVDFYSKPLDLDVLRVILARTFRMAELESANRQLREERGESASFCGMMGAAPCMQELFDRIRQVAGTDYPVLIRGESGTGKEMVARALHAKSPRAKERLIIINCGAIPENLLESELFGHEKGAFTGAAAKRAGRLEQADGGTVFLDEIGDMPLALQVKLLRFLQEGTLERVGGNKTLELDVRIVAATHVDLDQAIADGRFREDLYYRLNVVPLAVPPLRERPEDILLLARHFINEETARLNRGKMGLGPAAVAALAEHGWPGNVRELKNAVCRALAICSGKKIQPIDLGIPVGGKAQPAEEGRLMTIREARDGAELQALRQALAATDGNITQAAKLLEVSRPTLHDLIKKHGVEDG
ncbi:MAG: PEP-CTERM-box response regulator transcription factor [Desulfococcaceae bacterium]